MVVVASLLLSLQCLPHSVNSAKARIGGWESILRSWKLLLALCCLPAEQCEELYTEVFRRKLLEVAVIRESRQVIEPGCVDHGRLRPSSNAGM